MGKKATRPKGAVKFQIPIPSYMSDEIDVLASRMEKSQATMVELLLEAALEDRDSLLGLFGKWMLAATLADAGRKKTANDEVVRLQVYVSPEINEEIEALANDMRLPKIHLAASLLDAALDENAFIIHAVTAPLAKQFFKKLCSPQRKERAQRMSDAGQIPHGLSPE